VTATVAVVLYLVAAGYGVREWRCFLKPPWVVVALAAIAVAQATITFWYRSPLVL
jgi:membrane protein YdbS with pleckstrin-like domain